MGEEGVKENVLIMDRVGVFSTLTNSYALVAVGASENFYRYVVAYPSSAQVSGRKKKEGRDWKNEWGKDKGHRLIITVSSRQSCRM